MRQHGVLIDKTARFTWKQTKEIARNALMRSVGPIVKDILNVVLMAYEDTEGKDIVAFQEKIYKYINDMDAGEFTPSDVKKYNKEVQETLNAYLAKKAGA